MDFHFKMGIGIKKDTLLFSNLDKIFEFNFETSTSNVYYDFNNNLAAEPSFFQPNHDQKMFVISSSMDTVFVDTQTGVEIDIDESYDVFNIKEVEYEEGDKAYYLVCNSYKDRLGFFVLRIKEEEPKAGQFLIKWYHSLDIGDPNIYILRNKDNGLKELVVSFKVIYLNTYNIISLDISRPGQKSLVFRHESGQLWESECTGYLLKNTLEYITINKNGLFATSLGSYENK